MRTKKKRRPAAVLRAPTYLTVGTGNVPKRLYLHPRSPRLPILWKLTRYFPGARHIQGAPFSYMTEVRSMFGFPRFQRSRKIPCEEGPPHRKGGETTHWSRPSIGLRPRSRGGRQRWGQKRTASELTALTIDGAQSRTWSVWEETSDLISSCPPGTAVWPRGNKRPSTVAQ